MLYASIKHDHENPTLLKKRKIENIKAIFDENFLPSDVACNKQFPSPLVTNGYNFGYDNF
jgi:hypothetical protein